MAVNVPTAQESPPPPPPIYIPLTSIAMPGVVSDRLHRFGEFAHGLRAKAQEQAPDVVLNHSSNLIGAAELAAEAMVFKSNGSDLVSPQNRGKPLHYLIDPPRNILNSLSSNAKFDMTPGDLLKPSFYRRTFEAFTDLEAASTYDLAHQPKLINRWQARSTFTGIAAMSLVTLLPNPKDDAQETGDMARLSQDAPLQYGATRLKQALYVPGWGEHKTQMAGLLKMLGGGCAFLSGYRNISFKNGQQRYFINRAHSLGGLITGAAGLQLMLGLDNEHAWRNYGSTLLLRLGFVPKSIYNRYKNHDPNANWYSGSVATFQGKSVMAFLIGGAERDEEGRIIDKSAIRERALQADFAGFHADEEALSPQARISTPAAEAGRVAETAPDLGTTQG